MAPEVNERWEDLINPDHVKYIYMANGTTPRCDFCKHSGCWRPCNTCRSGSGKKLVKESFQMVEVRNLSWRIDRIIHMKKRAAERKLWNAERAHGRW